MIRRSHCINRRDESGAILVLASVGIVLAMISAALAIDLGVLAADRRTDQKIADLAALDASRDLGGVSDHCSPPPTASGPLCPAVISATRNFSAGDAETTISAERVSPNAVGDYVADANGSSVRVTVSSPRKPYFPFVGSDSRTVTARAIAGAGNAIGTVRVGSKVASADGSIDFSPLQVALLDKTMGALIGKPTYSLSAAGWEGLASGTVTFGALASALGAIPGPDKAVFNVGTVDQIGNATITYGDLLTAMAQGPHNNGTAADVLIKNSIQDIGLNVVGTSLSAPLKLYDLFDFGGVIIGNKQDVANASLNVLDVIRGGAIIADGNNLASFNLTAAEVLAKTGIAMPGVFDNVTVGMGLIQAPKTATGRPGKSPAGVYYTTAKTSQIQFKVDVALKIPLSTGIVQQIPAIPPLTPAITLPVPGLSAGSILNTTVSYYLQAGTAHASLHAVNCGTSVEPTSVEVWGVTEVGSSKIGVVADLGGTASVSGGLPILSILGVLNVKTTGVVDGPTIPGNPGEKLTFYPPYTATSPPKTLPGATTFSLPSLLTTSLTVDPLLANLNTGTLLSDLVSGINSTGLSLTSGTPGLATTVLKPLFDALGLSLGGADIWAPPPQTCAAVSVLNPAGLGSIPPVLRG